MGSQGIQARVSTDLLARCSYAPRPSPAPFAWRRGRPRLQSSRSARRGLEAGREGRLPGTRPSRSPSSPLLLWLGVDPSQAPGHSWNLLRPQRLSGRPG